MLTVFSALAELEREQIRERQQEGIAIAKQHGKLLGRPRLKKPLNFDEVFAKWNCKEITAVEAYKQLNISKASFYRLVQSE
jgi:DNA invertase Pin-like site-specific DNA recombinase